MNSFVGSLCLYGQVDRGLNFQLSEPYISTIYAECLCSPQNMTLENIRVDSYSALLAAWHEATFSLSLAPEAMRRTIYTAQKLKFNRKSFIAVKNLVSAFVLFL